MALLEAPHTMYQCEDPMLETEGYFWRSSTERLAKYITDKYQLNPTSSCIVFDALNVIEQFYRTRKSITCSGHTIDVTSSPILAEEGRVLLRLAINERVQHTLEVGFGFGMSTCHLLTAHEVTGGLEHLAIDPLEQSKYYQGCGLMNVFQARLGSRFLWIKEPSNIALPRLLSSRNQFDFCFIDGSHIFGDIFVDSYYINFLLGYGRVLVLHDAWLSATQTVRNILITNFGFREEPDSSVPNLVILRKVGEGKLDWKEFSTQFEPFKVSG